VQTIEGITLLDRQGELIVQCRPSAQAPLPDPDQLRRLVADAGFGRWAAVPEALDVLLARWAGAAEAFELVLARRLDARFTIEVGRDGLAAWALLTAAQGGAPVQPDDMVKALYAAGVLFGIDHAAVRKACASTVDVRAQVATAIAAVEGEDTRFELLVSDTRVRAPKVDEHGLIDYHELGDIPTVLANQPLMRRHPPTPGTDGTDVRGVPLRPKPGLDEPFDTPFVGVAVSEADANLLMSVDAGQPVHTRCGVHVEKVLQLKAVNMATGNIHFVGTVEVAGDVSPGMKIEASGDIIVKGMVDNAHLEAGGSIQVSGGVISHSALRATHSVTVRFVENSAIQAGTAIAVENMAAHSDLQALNQILVGTTAGARGRLIGGMARATMLVRAPTLGATAGGLTRVQVGINPVLVARQQTLEREIEHEHDEADKLEKIVHHLEAHGDPRHMLEKVKTAWQAELREWGHLLEEKVEFEHQLSLINEARVEVSVGVAGDVDLAFGKIVRQVRRHLGAGAFTRDAHDRLVFTPASEGKGAEVL